MTAPVVLITGASSGLGMAAAEQLRRRGACVYAGARSVDKMATLADVGIEVVKLDVTLDDSVRATAEQVLREQGRIDAVLCNAGVGLYGMVEHSSMDDAVRQFEVNLFGAVRVAQAVLPTMRAQRSGRVIFTESTASHVALPGSGWYGASKHALRAVRTSLRRELRGSGVWVSAIQPGLLRTGFEQAALEQLAQRAAHAAAVSAVPQQAPAQAAHYGDTPQQLLTAWHRLYANASSSQPTIEAMVHAVYAERPRQVYRTTPDAGAGEWATRLLPEPVIDVLMARMMARLTR